ncbi:MAG: hypothetical protein ACFFFC_18975 [Candidatus Thorarchaeota archaeon]
MQEQMLAVPLPMLLAIGFLIGFVFLGLGYREGSDMTRRYRFIGVGAITIGIMIPVTPISWYGYWIVTTGLLLGLIEIAMICVTLIIGILLIYKGVKIYSGNQ